MIYSLQRNKRSLLFFVYSFLFSSTLLAQVSTDSLMQMTLEQLLNVEIISANKFSTPINETPASVVIITRQEIKQLGYSSLAEILENVPGFYNVNDYTPLKNNFGIRGFWNDEWNKNIVFLVNGVPQRDVYSSEHIFYTMTIPVEAIEKIEIIRGPMSVNYGSGAFFGVINIITSTDSSGDTQKLFGSVGSQNTYKGGFHLVKHENDLQIDMTAKIYGTNGIDQNYKDMGVDTSASTYGDLKERDSYAGIKINYADFYATMSYDYGTNTYPLAGVPPVYAGSSYEARVNSTAIRFALGYNTSINKQFKINSKLTALNYLVRYRYDTFGLDNDEEFEQNGGKSIELDLNLKTDLTPDLNLIGGINIYSIYDAFVNLDIPYAGLDNQRKILNNDFNVYSGYILANFKINDIFTLSGGTRLEQMGHFSLTSQNNVGAQYAEDSTLHSKFDSKKINIDQQKIQNIPQLALLIQPHKNHLIKILYGQAISRPSFFNRAGINGPDLKNEKIQAFEINYLGELSPHISANVSMYRNNFNNLIIRTFQIDENNMYTSIRTNGGELHTTGLELGIRGTFLQNLTMDLSGVYQKTVDEKHPDIKPFSSPDMLGYLKILYNYSDYYLGITANYVSRIESRYDFELSDPTNPQSSFKGRIGAGAAPYINTGLNIIYEPPFMKGFSLDFKVANLFNTKIYYPTSEFQKWATKGLLGNGRTFLLSTNYEFR